VWQSATISGICAKPAVQRPVQRAVQLSVCTQRTVAVVKVNLF
jgi:hypothetical protein